MKCAILGNGPSRILYDETTHYDARIGCNIPWCKVDWTMIMDPDVVLAWSKDTTIINVPVYASVDAWRYSAGIKFRDYIIQNSLFLGLEKVPVHYSSGHLAARKALELGYKYIDLYGMDSYFNNTMDSYTRQYVKDTPTNHCKKWKTVWDDMINSNPDTVFNFIGK